MLMLEIFGFQFLYSGESILKMIFGDIVFTNYSVQPSQPVQYNSCEFFRLVILFPGYRKKIVSLDDFIVNVVLAS
jgi:hypothetical protein